MNKNRDIIMYNNTSHIMVHILYKILLLLYMHYKKVM